MNLALAWAGADAKDERPRSYGSNEQMMEEVGAVKVYQLLDLNLVFFDKLILQSSNHPLTFVFWKFGYLPIITAILLQETSLLFIRARH